MGDTPRSADEVTPAEFTKRMPEGKGAGPDAPETVEPHQGHQEKETGAGGPPMKGLGGSGPEGNEVTREGEGAPTEESRGSR